MLLQFLVNSPNIKASLKGKCKYRRIHRMYLHALSRPSMMLRDLCIYPLPSLSLLTPLSLLSHCRQAPTHTPPRRRLPSTKNHAYQKSRRATTGNLVCPPKTSSCRRRCQKPCPSTPEITSADKVPAVAAEWAGFLRAVARAWVAKRERAGREREKEGHESWSTMEREYSGCRCIWV